MSRRVGNQSNCSIATALSILGDKWTLLIARDIMMGNQNFEAIQKSLNISRNLLTERLKSMINKKLIRRQIPDNKKRAMYVPTERCKDLVKVFLSLSLWADRWVPDTRRPKIAGVINQKVTEIGLKVVPFNTLTTSLCKKYHSKIILRGLRAVSDFEYEFQLAGMNRKLNNTVETIFLMSDIENQIISSRFVKEIAQHKGDLKKFTTKSTIKLLRDMYA